MLKLIPNIIETLLIMGSSAIGAELAIEKNGDPMEYRTKKSEFFRDHVIDLLDDVLKTKGFPKWLVNFLKGMIINGDGFSRLIVDIFNARRVFGHDGETGSIE